MKSLHSLRRWHFPILVLLVLQGLTIGGALVSAQSGSVTSSAVPSNAAPEIGDQIVVAIQIDVSNVDPPDNALGSFSASLNWDPDVLAYNSHSGILAGFAGVVNDTNASSGKIIFNGANALGATGEVTVLTITFDVAGSGTSVLDLEYSAMAAASTFKNLLPLLTVNDGHVDVGPAPYYSLTIAVDPAESGTTDPEVGEHSYPEGTIVEITAVPAAMYEFDHWSGACTGSGSCQVIMDADKAVTAHLTELPLTCYPLTLSHEGYGSDPVADPTYSPGCPLGRYVESETINLSGAIPEAGWQVSGWIGTSQDESTAGTNSLTMPASAHTVSVLYRTHIYLPIILGGVLASEPALSQTIVEENGAIALSASNPATRALDNNALRTGTPQVTEEQDLTVDPAITVDLAIIEENEEITPALPNAALDNNSAQVVAAQVSGKRDLTIDSPASSGNGSTYAVDESPIHRVLSVVMPFSYMLLSLFVFLVFFLLTLYIIRERSMSNK